MSEMKAINLNSMGCYNINEPVYLKSEADKVIAELEEKLDIYKRGWMENDRVNAKQYAEIRHHKYKRCLAMALLWLERAENSTDLENEFVSRRRCSKWMELAEVFK